MAAGNLSILFMATFALVLVLNVQFSASSPLPENDGLRDLRSLSDNDATLVRVRRVGGRAPVSVGKAPVATGKAPTATATSGGSSSSGSSGLGSAIATGAASGLAGIAAAKLLGGGGR